MKYYKHLDTGIVHVVRQEDAVHVVSLCIWEENAWLMGEPCVEVPPPPTCFHCVMLERVEAS